MTTKLYYIDSYIKEFTAKVLQCEELSDNGYSIVLDRTAFFPEGAGQGCDKGKIGDGNVSYVKEKDGIIYHITDKWQNPGGEVFCCLDFDARFEKMQCHTAEHILSGLLHKEYGIDNVGFHLGDVEVTMDTSRQLTDDEIYRLEREANRVVCENHQIECGIYKPEQTAGMSYRSKLDIKENIRLVKIGDVDLCACSAPHVAATGEIGYIKIVKSEKHKSGTRLYILAGYRADSFVSRLWAGAEAVSELLSVPCLSIDDGVRRLWEENHSLKQRIFSRDVEYAELYLKTVENTAGNLVVAIPGVGMNILRQIISIALEKTSGILVLLSQRDEGYSYLITSKNSLGDIVNRANSALCGRGGGRDNFAEGYFCQSLDNIKKFFEA